MAENNSRRKCVITLTQQDKGRLFLQAVYVFTTPVVAAFGRIAGVNDAQVKVQD